MTRELLSYTLNMFPTTFVYGNRLIFPRNVVPKFFIIGVTDIKNDSALDSDIIPGGGLIFLISLLLLR